MSEVDKLRYPLGTFQRPTAPLDAATRTAFVKTIEDTPATFRALVAPLSDAQLDTPYRPGGWTVRQVVHHVADSHMNAFIRIKLALTEDAPTIKTYEEQLWAELPDVKRTPVDVSLRILEALHERWIALLRGMAESDFQKVLVHPDLGRMTIDEVLALYEWHGRHHAAHIQQALSVAA
jgi:uncharacterized damage-inducible protein DinB